MGLREAFFAGLARQLGGPSGFVGRTIIANRLNRANRANVGAAVDALALQPGDAAADLGFGGGVGLPLLLDRVGPTGTVHGVDPSETMRRRAESLYRKESRLTIHDGSLTALPLPDASVNGAICINVVYFVAELERAFAELARVMAPGGTLVVGSGDPVGMASLPFTRTGFLIRPIEELVAGLGAVGLPVKEDRRVGSGEHAYHLLIAQRD
jgi:SAM-dependent methyltransferase